MSRSRLLLAALAAALPAPVALAADIAVPGDFPTIQAAVNAAADGDRILVAPGVYNETVDMIGVAVRIVGTGSGPGAVVIDANGGWPAIDIDGADPTIAHGVENLTIRDAGTAGGFAGGLSIENASPLIKDVVIRNCFANTGAAIWINESDATFEDIRILNNETVAGGVVYIDAPGEIIEFDEVRIVNNVSGSTNFFTFRGAVEIDRARWQDNTCGTLISNRPNTTVAVSNSILRSNDSVQSPILVDSGSSMTFVNCTALENDGSLADFSTVSGGAAIRIENSIILPQDSPAFAGDGGTIVEYSMIPGGHPGPGNIDAEPNFESRAENDLRLRPGSPGVDAGSFTASGFGQDFNGLQRVVDDRNIPNVGEGAFPFVDMGAHERSLSVRYVRPDAPAGGDGFSWDSAYAHPQDALEEDGLFEIEEVWIAAGTYAPDNGSGDRMASFRMRSGLAIRGGYAGGETQRGEADAATNVTLLSGDIGAPTFTDNVQRVVDATDVDETGILQGVTIERGFAREVDAAHPATGAGLFINGGSPSIRNVTFQRNSTFLGFTDNAAALASFDASPILRRVRFIDHQTPQRASHVARFEGGSPSLENVLIASNEVNSGPALVIRDAEDAVMSHVTVAGNRAAGEGPTAGVGLYAGLVTLTNSIVHGNIVDTPDASLPDFQQQIVATDDTPNGGAFLSNVAIEDWDGSPHFMQAVNVNDLDPRFVDPDGADDVPYSQDDDWRLRGGSAAIDAGNATFTTTANDLDGNARRLDDSATPDSGGGTGIAPDLGAYEFQGTSCPADVDGDGEVGFNDLVSVLAAWGVCDGCPEDITGDGVVSFADLVELLATFGPCP